MIEVPCRGVSDPRRHGVSDTCRSEFVGWPWSDFRQRTVTELRQAFSGRSNGCDCWPSIFFFLASSAARTANTFIFPGPMTSPGFFLRSPRILVRGSVRRPHLRE